jgi:protein-tyrosine-phosphatase
MPSVLFVCTANRFRSPLAASLLQRDLRALGFAESWTVDSAGIWAAPGQPVLPQISGAAQRFSIDLSSHRSVRVSRKLLARYDLILVMQSSQREALLTEYPDLEERVYLFSQVVERRTYDIPDAAGSEEEALELIAELESLIRRGLESICVLATYLHNSKRMYPSLQA